MFEMILCDRNRRRPLSSSEKIQEFLASLRFHIQKRR